MPETEMRVTLLLTDKELDDRIESYSQEVVRLDPGGHGVPGAIYRDMATMLELREYRKIHGPLDCTSLEWKVK